MPVPLALLAALPAVLGLIQGGIGAGILGSAKRPTYKTPGAFNEALSLQQARTGADMPGYEQGIDLASLAASNAIGGAQQSGNANSLIPAIQATQSANLNNLTTRNAEYQSNQMNQYLNMLGQKAQYQDQEFQMNKFAPYADKVNMGTTMIGGGIKNVFGGLDMMSMQQILGGASQNSNFNQGLNTSISQQVDGQGLKQEDTTRLLEILSKYLNQPR